MKRMIAWLALGFACAMPGIAGANDFASTAAAPMLERMVAQADTKAAPPAAAPAAATPATPAAAPAAAAPAPASAAPAAATAAPAAAAPTPNKGDNAWMIVAT